MTTSQIHILLADDDEDDRFLFQEALGIIPITVELSTVKDGVELLHWLKEKAIKPHLIFLDLNMPRKNGYECLVEIKQSPDLQSLTVIIFSTSAKPANLDYLYENGALYYVQKPGDFKKLTQVIERVLRLPEKQKRVQPPKEEFIF